MLVFHNGDCHIHADIIISVDERAKKLTLTARCRAVLPSAEVASMSSTLVSLWTSSAMRHSNLYLLFPLTKTCMAASPFSSLAFTSQSFADASFLMVYWRYAYVGRYG